MDNILEIKDLYTSFLTTAGEVKAVNGVSLSVPKGKVLGVVGESGSGKSVTMLSVLKLLGAMGKIKSGSIMFNNDDLVKKDKNFMRNIRGNKIGMIFQDPMTSLNPVLTIGYQLREPLITHKKMTKEQAQQKAIEMLKAVGIPDPESRIESYPHEFSGGMRQRVMIAMALCCDPELIIADEPTTALDVTIQAQILDLMKQLKDSLSTSIIIITHDLGVVADIADEIAVMYAGNVVEKGTCKEVFYNAKHPYTLGLLKSVPNPDNMEKERLQPIKGYPPDLMNLPEGCPFSARCSKTMKICLKADPKPRDVGNGHTVKCWLLEKEAHSKQKVI